MINREILETQRGQYLKGREQAAASIAAFNGAIEAMDHLLALVTEIEAAQSTTDNNAAIEAAKENTNG